MTLPDSNFLSAPLWLIATLHVVTFTLHLLAMNFVLGGTAVVVLGRLPGKWRDPAISRIVKLLPTGMAATVSLGVAPLLFLQLVYYQQAYSAAITSAWLWILIVAAVIVGYYLLYGAAFAGKRNPARVAPLMSLALLPLLYVSWVYSSVFSMAERPDLYQALYAANQTGWVVNTDVGSWLIRWLHMLTGALAVGGYFVGVIGRESESVFRLGKRSFLWGMIAAMVVGTAYLLTLGDHLRPFMRSPSIWILTVAILLSIGSMHLFFKRRFVLTGLLVGLSVLGMVAVRHALRLMVLDGWFDPTTIRVAPQWDVFALFLVFFVLAIVAVTYMLRLFLRSSSPG